MAVISAFSKCLVPPPGVIDPPQTANKNWNPGNYIEGTDDSQWAGIKTRLNQTNDPDGHWKGAMMRISWREMESTNAAGTGSGGYAGMNKIQTWLDQIAAFPGKRLMIFLGMKTFGSTSPTSPAQAVPDYMRNSTTYSGGIQYAGSQNGQYAYGSSIGGPGGFVPNMHVPAVKNRFIALMEELANRFNDNPFLEAVVFSEATIAKPVGAPTPWPDQQDWYDNYRDGLAAAKTALSNVQISQWVNSPRDQMESFVPEIRALGIGLGMTDLTYLDEGFNYRNDLPGTGDNNTPPGNIQHCQESAGLAIITGHVSYPSMDGSATNRCQKGGFIQTQAIEFPRYPGLGKTRQFVHDWARDTVGVTHMIYRHGGTSKQPATGVRDPNMPADCTNLTAAELAEAGFWTATSDAISGSYANKLRDTVTDNWIHHPSSDISTVTTRPAGWD